MKSLICCSVRFGLTVALGVCLLSGTPGVKAGPIAFDKNEINFIKPSDNDRRTFQFNAPTLTMRDDGYAVSDLTYTVTSKVATGKIDDVGWTSNRMFQLTAAAGVIIHIEGETDITLTGGTDSGGLLVSGSIFQGFTDKGLVLTEPLADIKFDPNNPDKKYPIKWNMDSKLINLDAGMYRLELDSGTTFNPGAVGDKLTISSTYLATVRVLEPSTSALLVSGLAFLSLVHLVRKRKGRTVRMAAALATVALTSVAVQAGTLTWTGQTSLRVMLREELGLGLDKLGRMGRERFGDLRVQLLPDIAQHAIMRRVLH